MGWLQWSQNNCFSSSRLCSLCSVRKQSTLIHSSLFWWAWSLVAIREESDKKGERGVNWRRQLNSLEAQIATLEGEFLH